MLSIKISADKEQAHARLLHPDCGESSQRDDGQVYPGETRWLTVKNTRSQPRDYALQLIDGAKLDGSTIQYAISRASVATSVCGDGRRDDELGESCDDGNTSSNDGCSSSCQYDSGGSGGSGRRGGSGGWGADDDAGPGAHGGTGGGGSGGHGGDDADAGPGESGGSGGHGGSGDNEADAG